MHLEKRFPENELMDWKLFELSVLSTTADYDSGKSDIGKLVSRYKHLFQEISEPTKLISSQYRDFRFIVSEKLKAGLLKTFRDVIQFTLAEEDFSLLARLLDICGTFQASSADCERGFSLMNAIKTHTRNRLETEHLDMLMRIKSFQGLGRTVNLDTIYNIWSSRKDRREKL